MTRKHFNELAEQLKRVQDQFKSGFDWQSHCRAIALICARSNPSFDRTRFLQACGFEPNG